jgi:hypothetical protein
MLEKIRHSLSYSALSCVVTSCISVQYILSPVQNRSISHAHPQVHDSIFRVQDIFHRKMGYVTANSVITNVSETKCFLVGPFQEVTKENGSRSNLLCYSLCHLR